MKRLVLCVLLALLSACATGVTTTNTPLPPTPASPTVQVEPTRPLAGASQAQVETATATPTWTLPPTLTETSEPATPPPTAAATLTPTVVLSPTQPSPTVALTSTAVLLPTESPLTGTPAPLLPTDIPPSPPPIAPMPPQVYEAVITLPTYGFEVAFQPTQPDDPIYPYPRLDPAQVGPPAPRAYRAVVLENGYVSLTILPELGGRVYRWVDKATGRQLLYNNPVVKPTGWGYRGWWLAAGGIEWAFPVEEHGLNEWRTWQYSTGSTAYGLSVSVWDTDDRTGMQVGATVSLDAEHAYAVIQPWARNATDQSHEYQLWLNAMLTLGGNAVSPQTQFIIPTDSVVVHSTGDGGLPGPGGVMSWPVYGGRDMSWYANWSGYLGFFAPSVTSGFVGLYDHAADQGMVRAFAPGGPAGTKFFGPAGLSPALWTDDGSTYVELWSGATGSFWTYATLDPGESVGWTEYWYPVSGLGGYSFANRDAALQLIDTGGGAEVGVAVSRYTSGELTLWAGGQLAERWPVTLAPGQAFRADWVRPAGVSGALGLRLQDGSGATVAQTGTAP